MLDYLCQIAVRHNIYYLWRPVLRDPKDDMVLEVAVAGECGTIVSYNKRDFGGASRFGIEVVTARELAEREGESISQLMTTALAEKLSALLTEEYLEERARRGSRKKFERVLSKVSDREPEPGDEL